MSSLPQQSLEPCKNHKRIMNIGTTNKLVDINYVSNLRQNEVAIISISSTPTSRSQRSMQQNTISFEP